VKALALVALVSFSALAEGDAPLAVAQVIPQGSVAPITGPALCLPDSQAILVAQRLVTAEAEATAAKDLLGKSTPGWVIPVVAIAAVLVAGGAGVGIGYAVSHP
jgi:hypothetical protein